MTELSAPYRFVPLSRYILRPSWASHVSHDHPFNDGVCGELELSLTAHTRLCVGGKQRPANEKEAGLVEFFRTPEGKLAIPGSSLKGMLRTVMEIACFGHFQQVENQQLGVRDISRGNNFYSLAMNRMPISVGWLRFDAGEWRLTPCSYVRLNQQKLIDHFRISKELWKKTSAPEKRYNLLNGLQGVSFNTAPYPYDCKLEAVDLGAGEHHGTVVVTGQPGKPFDSGKGAKKREFIFYNERPDALTTISPEVMQGFLHIHADSAEWKYWKAKLNQPVGNFPGVPIFYHQQAGQVISLGLSRMYKLPYKHSLHDAIGHTQPAHVMAEQPDMAGLVFGWLDEQSADQNLRGRVMPSNLHTEELPSLRRDGPVVLSTPKPTFYPAYIHQPRESGAYKTLMDKDAELAGWKRYPVREDADVPELTDLVKKNKKVQTYLETVPKGTTFSGKLRVHNLRLVELGALLWCIDFGQRDQCRHALGLGKPLGFGQVALNLQVARLKHNDIAHSAVSSDTLLQAARTAFEHYMDNAWQQATGGSEQSWEKSPQVTHLLAMADPVNARGNYLSAYSEHKQFMEAKQGEVRLSSYVGHQPETSIKEALGAPPGDTASLESLLAEAEKRQAEKRQLEEETARREQREQEKATMSPEQKLLADIEDRLQADELNKTQVEKLAKDLLALTKMEYDWELADQECICALGQRGLELGNQLAKTKLQKAAEKVIKKFCTNS